MLVGTGSLDITVAAEPANELTPEVPATEEQSSEAAKPSKQQPATLSSKKRRERKADVFKPTELRKILRRLYLEEYGLDPSQTSQSPALAN